MGLDGTIPYEVASLMNLKALDMSNNNIKGPIPQEFQNLAMLGKSRREEQTCLFQHVCHNLMNCSSLSIFFRNIDSL